MKKIFPLFLAIIQTSDLSAQVSDSSASSEKAPWSLSTTAYYYFVPDNQNILSVLGYADYKSLHLEARYNYEALHTTSVFAGWRLEAGEKLQFAATPMLGFLFGQTTGIAPGLELELSYKALDFYSETEWVADFSGGENNYLYTWLELAATPFKNFRLGISAQRTRIYQTDFALQRGFLAEYSFWKMTAGLYYFDPFTSSNFLILSLKFAF